MKSPCGTCIVQAACTIDSGEDCPDLKRWLNRPPYERYLEKRPGIYEAVISHIRYRNFKNLLPVRKGETWRKITS